jgi:excisionase family DNA binding protein
MSLSAGDVMTSAEVARLLEESVKNVEAWARAGILPGFKLGKRWKFLRSDIEDALRDARRQRRPYDS